MNGEDKIQLMAKYICEHEFGCQAGEWQRVNNAADKMGEHCYSWQKRNRIMSTARQLYNIATTEN